MYELGGNWGHICWSPPGLLHFQQHQNLHSHNTTMVYTINTIQFSRIRGTCAGSSPWRLCAKAFNVNECLEPRRGQSLVLLPHVQRLPKMNACALFLSLPIMRWPEPLMLKSEQFHAARCWRQRAESTSFSPGKRKAWWSEDQRRVPLSCKAQIPCRDGREQDMKRERWTEEEEASGVGCKIINRNKQTLTAG